MPSKPQVIILAGPNGAGKSTSKPRLIPPDFAFLNADDMARELGGDPSPARDLAAGRLLLKRMAELEAARTPFAVETNLANRTLALRVPKWQAAGYRVSLFYIWVPSDDLAVARVAQRVETGGHNIPEETIRRRYVAGLRNFFDVYQPLVDNWRLYDNSGSEGVRLVAHGLRFIRSAEAWEAVRRAAVQSERKES